MNKKKLPKAIRPAAARAPAPRSEAATEASKPKTASLAEEGAAEPAEIDDSPEGRRAAAVKLVKRFSWWSGAAGLIPAPFIDLAAVSGVQIQMLRRLSQIYDVPFSENRGKALLAGIAGSMIPASSGLGAASLIKGLPVLGATISFVTMPVLSAGATYAIGMAFIQHFISGGTLLDFNPPDYHEFIKAHRHLRPARSEA